MHSRPAPRKSLDLETPAKLLGPLAHRGESDTLSTNLSDAPPIVGDLHKECLRRPVEREADDAIPSLGVAGDVCECFLNDAIRGDLDGGGERRKIVGRVERDSRPAWPPMRPLFEGADEAELVEGGRAKIVDDAAHVGDGLLCLGLQFGEERGDGLRVVDEEVHRGIVLEGEGGESRAESVVEVAAEAAALLLAGRDEPLPRPLEVGGEAGGVGGGSGLPRRSSRSLRSAGENSSPGERGETTIRPTTSE